MQERSVITCRRLVTAAAEMFDRKGYVNATLGEITGAARVTKGALYFHFASKGDLAHAVQTRGCTLLAESVDRLAAGSGSPLQTLIDFTHWLARGLREEAALRANFRLSRDLRGEETAGGDFTRAWMTTAWSLLDRAGAAGELQDGADRTGPQTLLAAAVAGIELLAATDMPDEELTARVAALWDLALPGLVGPSGRTAFRTTPP
ncbi:TetR/AcrR family transcriptional regulator [Streptomyces sp. BR123]|uniref:ScbR family autoregulator-binding transcription factor n=1 Tax=Streptomyces sp. BR123 TaxID=2749828 RepID=UPI0015C41F98|nr:ScbR family autoregulator-binding transcription factor [Streptomyces sp. BR123]NXY96229.1 TetR/AcrR family transcriptional regulator [Streptomyces sp. BR123]